METLKITKSDGEFMECPGNPLIPIHFMPMALIHGIIIMRYGNFAPPASAVIYLYEAKSERNHT